MKIHLYASCKNEELLLPFFFEYYDNFVDNYYILYDVSSIDNSEKLIDTNPKCIKVPFDNNGEFRDDILMFAKNSNWKLSIGKADWVIVADIDEFLYHPNLTDYLQLMRTKGISIPLTQGYDMFSESLPKNGTSIIHQIKEGVPNKNFSKHLIFDPNKIIDIDYFPGSHRAEPKGKVTYDDTRELKVLHYKYIGGYERMRDRWISFGLTLSQINIMNGWSTKRLDESEIEKRYHMLKENKIQVID